ncbi:hypothetical protein GOEFS_038_00170 [Gordonia effusa NBRC 100432]|uniref:Uncharacterized protein n=1 Tax=Gordonia effusa NBRC 100432 TaxID=1077974 RepID=H0QY49_9ACTN|nr:hypothetical protein [Gordonia effusa]GAB17750.1 hypothetical protein GOEFS_038_00170 [Gordonia effusa NBRC 100432]
MGVDPAKSRAVSQVVRQHPAMSVIAISPAIVIFVLLWWLVHPAIAIIAGLAAVGAGYYLLVRQR